MKKQLIMIGGLVILLLLIYRLTESKSSLSSIEFEKEDLIEMKELELHEEETKVYIVDVKGEVNYPGIYEVDETFRVHDVVILAGGLTEFAQSKSVNFAQKIRDEMVVYIPSINEEEELTLYEHQNQAKVSINQGSLEELQTLPGIGNVKAQSIIDYRTEINSFKSIEELIQVNGIGEKTLERLRDHIEI